jgi:hypothetical protein
MSPVVSYYAIVRDSAPDGPTGVIRRRPNAPELGGHRDEVLARDWTWKPTSRVAEYHSRDVTEWDLVPITESEAGALIDWLRARQVSRATAGPPPVPGGRTLGRAWSVEVEGEMSDPALDTLLARLGMIRRGALEDPVERDFGLRVMRNDPASRVMLRLLRVRPDRWLVTLDHLGAEPDARTVGAVRQEASAGAAEAGLSLGGEWTRSSPSTGPVPNTPVPAEPRTLTRLFALWLRGGVDKAKLAVLRERLRLDDQGDELDDENGTEFGARSLPSDGTYRARLRLDREGEDRWVVSASHEGRRPPEERISQWREEVLAATAEVGLAPEREWVAPAPPSAERTPLAPPARRTSLPVREAYVARLRGTLTGETLDRLRAGAGLRPRGRLDDDWSTDFGYRLLRDEPGRPVRLSLSRVSDNEWRIALSYQGDPPQDEVVERTRAEVLAAAADAGLTVEQEWR